MNTALNNAGPMKNVINNAYSTTRRPFNKITSTNNSNFTKKVNTVTRTRVNTARPKALISAVKGNKGNAVKASACWVWRPKHKILDHGNPQQDLNNKGVIDSGCSRHMTGNRSYLTDYEEIDGGFVAFGGNSKGEKITRKGKIKTGKLDFKDVYFVKELKFNLFSVSQMCDKKNSVLFTNTECVVLSPDFKLTDENHVLLKVPRKDNMYSVDLKNVIPQGGLTCLFAKATLDESNLWHKRLGHVNFKTMNKLVRRNLVRGLPSKLFEINQTCVACQKGKQHIASLAEKKNKTLIEAARTMLANSKLPTTFWAEAVNTACYVQNRVLVIKPHNKTPYELFLGRKHALSFMRPFGCPIIILNTIDHLGKFDGKADEEFFVGYSTTSKAFKVFNSRTRIVEENLHVQFSENTSNIVGSGPTWLFHIDALTNSINYKPVVTWNQSNGNTGTKACDNAGKARMETIPGKDYILLPMWPADPLFSQNSKDSLNAGFKSSGEEEKKDAEDPGKDSEISSTEEPRINQEKDASVNNTNNINTISLTVNDTSIYGCADDPNIPELEDIIYSDDDEDVGAEADMNNLDAFMLVIPIPTTRIHKDYPQIEQIIRDMNISTIKTRRMTKNLKTRSCKLLELVKNPVFHSKTKHIEIRHHFIRDSNEKKLIPMIKIHTDKNIADLLTKAFDFWATTKVKTVNGEVQLQALVDGKKVIITETSVRRDLQLEDAEGIKCLPNVDNFEQLALMGNVDSSVKFLMYPRFVQVFLDKQVGDMSTHDEIFVTPSHTKKVFGNMKRVGKGFSRAVTPLFPTMMVQAQEEMGEEPIADEAANEENVPTQSNDPPLSRVNTLGSGEDRLKLKELMDLCTKLSDRVLDLETTKTAQAKEIASLKKRVKKLERKRKSKTPGMKRLFKIGRSAQVVSSEDEGLGDQEDASKQGRKIDDIDKDAEVTLVDETQGRYDDAQMFDTDVFNGEEVFVAEQSEKVVEEVVSTAKVSVAATITTEEITLAQALAELRSAKPKVVVQEPVQSTTTTAPSTIPKAKSITFRDPSESTTRTTLTPIPLNIKDKGKAKMIKPEKPLKMKEQIRLDEELAFKLQAE
ncbi:ribonuclease H-like domain-containing protein [Tanacetum coccineum]